MSSKKRWFAIYTRHRWEKKVFHVLNEKGIESYCPLNKIERKWSDRLKIVEEPLFKSYVFVKVSEEEKAEVRLTHGVVNFVYWLGKPAIVKDREIDNIRRFLDQHHNIHVIPLELRPENKVRILSGLLMDKTGKIVAVTKNQVKVIIESIGFALIANIDKSKVELINR